MTASEAQALKASLVRGSALQRGDSATRFNV
jgi:hypothetical protein